MYVPVLKVPLLLQTGPYINIQVADSFLRISI